MNIIYGEKIKLFKDSIINTIGDYSKTQIGIIEKIITNTSDLIFGFSEIVNDTNNMNMHMGDLKDIMEFTKLKVAENEVDKIFNDLEMEYNLSSILPKKVIIDTIIELKCDREIEKK